MLKGGDYGEGREQATGRRERDTGTVPEPQGPLSPLEQIPILSPPHFLQTKRKRNKFVITKAYFTGVTTLIWREHY